ncbi:aminotransferase class III-fold pyridoxal phosphate-dependent enzyme [Dolichospermum sp. ST_sed1]|nr:aminotransferase class III-fold pyridoxal phosphate-dependent enzyme [Dolichospermum sp. ST_sed1]
MNLFDVYDLQDIIPVRGMDCEVFDNNDQRYLDMYGGHAVISIGHSQPHYVNKMKRQLESLVFYSNSIINPLQEELAAKLGEISGYEDHSLFLCNSGAEANENACKLASFHTKRKKILCFNGAFHGRTSLAIATSDYPSATASINEIDHVVRIPLNDVKILIETLNDEFAAVIIEGIQGLSGIHAPTTEYFTLLRSLCDKFEICLIVDEVQSGYGRCGKFFAHQLANVQADLITVAKGMGNGFPVAGVLVAPHIKAKKGLLGTTFGGSHLACTSAIAVLDVIKELQLIQNAQQMGLYLMGRLTEMNKLEKVRGAGLMIAFDFENNAANLRKKLLFEKKIFTGSAKSPETVRLLPPLTLTQQHADEFLQSLKEIIN